MKPRNGAATAALVISILALVVSLSVGSFAAAKIGKNLVVTKSITNGAVTTGKIKPSAVDSSRIKNSSITSADLAPGAGRSALFASVNNSPTAPGTSLLMAPIGSTEPGEATLAIASVTMQVAGLRVGTETQVFQSLTVAIMNTPPGGAATPVLACTVAARSGHVLEHRDGGPSGGLSLRDPVERGPCGAALVQLGGYTVRVP